MLFMKNSEKNDLFLQKYYAVKCFNIDHNKKHY